MSAQEPRARLSIVGTPIGNLGDITLRALETLRSADLIAAEDTRRTRKLLAHYEIARRLLSFHRHNHRERTERILQELEAGRHVALVSDAGMPGISDPGSELVAAVAGRGFGVEVVPGPTAAVAAVAISGLDIARFHFEGFLPARGGPRRRRLDELANVEAALVIYEAPHRLLKTLNDMLAAWGDRQVALSRELTKMYEETLRGSLGAVLATFEASAPRGEFTIVCAGRQEHEAPASVSRERLERELAYLLEHEGLSRRDAIKELAQRHKLTRRALYRLFP